jgi:hypothetical protein
MTRISDRGDFEPPVRIRLLERDMDQYDEVIDRLTTTLDKVREDFSDSLEGMRKVLIGMLISLATAAVLLAVNLAFLQ